MGRDIKIVQKKILQEVDQKCKEKERERKMRTILRVLSLGNGESGDS